MVVSKRAAKCWGKGLSFPGYLEGMDGISLKVKRVLSALGWT